MNPLALLLAITITLAWDPNRPEEKVTSYILYEMRAGNWIKLGQTTDTTMTLSLPRGIHTFAVTAVNAAAESPFSTPLTINLKRGMRARLSQ